MDASRCGRCPDRLPTNGLRDEVECRERRHSQHTFTIRQQKGQRIRRHRCFPRGVEDPLRKCGTPKEQGTLVQRENGQGQWGQEYVHPDHGPVAVAALHSTWANNPTALPANAAPSFTASTKNTHHRRYTFAGHAQRARESPNSSELEG